MPGNQWDLGPPPALPDVRPRRLLRRQPAAPRSRARGPGRSRRDAVLRRGRGVGLLLRGRCLLGDPRGGAPVMAGEPSDGPESRPEPSIRDHPTGNRYEIVVDGTVAGIAAYERRPGRI